MIFGRSLSSPIAASAYSAAFSIYSIGAADTVGIIEVVP